MRDNVTGYTRQLGIAMSMSAAGGAYMDPVLYSEASVTMLGSEQSEKLKNMTNVCLMRSVSLILELI